eukprot:Tbor_TRINITY_DN5571_c1_g1::TRINITY_DN5571_c1_g1_i1::g.13574::m.13574
MLEAIEDDVPITKEADVWLQVAQSLAKPILQRSDADVSCFITLLKRLSYVQHNQLSLDCIIEISKVAKHVTVGPGVTILVKEEISRSSVQISEHSCVLEPWAVALNSPLSTNGASGTSGSIISEDLTYTAMYRHALAAKGTRPFYLLVKGTIALERDTENGRVRTELPNGSGFGDALSYDALLVGSRYITLTETNLISLTWECYEALLGIPTEEQELQRRIRFLQHEMLVPIFGPAWGPDSRNPNTTMTMHHHYRALAKAVFPVMLQTKEIAVRQGAFSSEFYFIVDGKLKVVREIDFSSTTGGVSGQFTNPCIRLFDLATLNVGEYFGELGLIRHSVDTKPVPDERLLTVTEEDIVNEEDEERYNDDAQKSSGITSLQMGNKVGCSHGDLKSELERLQIDPSIPSIRRQATVYAVIPSLLLVLPRDRFMAIIRQTALVRMREYTKGYPSAAVIKAHFMKQKQWEQFKTQLINSAAYPASYSTPGSY